jgi:hypothetical protein
VLVLVCAGLLNPFGVGRIIALVGVSTAPWMDVRVASAVTMSDALLALSIPFLLVGRRGQLSRDHFAPTRWMTGFALLVLLGGLLGSLVRGSFDGAGIGLRLGISVALAVVVTAYLVASRGAWYVCASLYCAGASVSAAVGLISSEQFGIFDRAVGLTNHPNHLGFSMLIAMPLAAAVSTSRRPVHRVIGVSTVVLSILALVASGSRAAFGGLVVAGITLLVVNRRFRIASLVIAGLLGVIGWMTLRGSIGPGSSAFSRVFSPTESEQRSSDLRLGNYQEAVDLIVDNPVVGRGFADALAFHSVPLQVLVVAGILGAAALIVAGRACWRAVRGSMSRPGEPIAQFCAAGMVGTFAALLVSNQLIDRYFTLGVALISYGWWTGLPSRHPAVDRPAHSPLPLRDGAKSPLTPNRPTSS